MERVVLGLARKQKPGSEEEEGKVVSDGLKNERVHRRHNITIVTAYISKIIIISELLGTMSSWLPSVAMFFSYSTTLMINKYSFWLKS